jgi:hypothetical protein
MRANELLFSDSCIKVRFRYGGEKSNLQSKVADLLTIISKGKVYLG